MAGPGVGLQAVNRACLSWHSRRVGAQGPCSPGSWGWGTSKSKTQAGMKSCGKTLKSEQNCLSANDFITLPEAGLTPPRTSSHPPAHGSGEDQFPGPVTSLRQQQMLQGPTSGEVLGVRLPSPLTHPGWERLKGTPEPSPSPPLCPQCPAQRPANIKIK